MGSATEDPPDPTGVDPSPTDQPPGTVDRVRAYAERQAGRAVAGAELARRRSRLVDVAWMTGERDRRAVGSVLAGAVAFRLFVYILPLFLAVLTIAGLVVGLDDEAPERLGEEVGLSGYVVSSVATASQDAERGVWFLVPLSLWAVYTAGSATARVLHAIHTLAWGLPPKRVGSKLVAAGMTFLVAIGVLLAIGATRWVRAHSPGAGILAASLGILPFAALWLLVSWALPHDKRARWPALVPGALLMGVAAWLIQLVSVYVLAERVANASNLYGSLGVAAALLAWLYILGRVMVAAAMLNATLWERRIVLDGAIDDEPPGDESRRRSPDLPALGPNAMPPTPPGGGPPGSPTAGPPTGASD